jgi:hypothetical protein
MFVKKLRHDQTAVKIGFVLKWNNSIIKGRINRLKFLKQSMSSQPTSTCCGYGFYILESVHELGKWIYFRLHLNTPNNTLIHLRINSCRLPAIQEFSHQDL